MVQILKGHVSPETAYVVNDYPYGFRLRCKIRYWLEYSPKQGFRLVSQTTNPKAVGGEVWNKPKASTYAKIAACMYLDDRNHVTWAALGIYTNGAEAASWRDQWGEGVPDAASKTLDVWVKAKLAYDAKKAEERHQTRDDVSMLGPHQA